jgi:hypothetical protein
MRYCGPTRRELLVDGIHGRGLPDKLEKNGSPLYYREAPKEERMDVMGLFSIPKGSGKYLLKPTGSILSRLFMGILSFKEEKAYISSLCRMEPPGMQPYTKQHLQERGIEVISWPRFESY